MKAWRLVPIGVATMILFTLLQPDSSSASGLTAMAAARGMVNGHTPSGVTPVFHSRRAESFYCFPRNYWWFYRPYTTAAEGYARCMPYFHYAPQVRVAPRGPGRLK
jgi:hypothetical protein